MMKEKEEILKELESKFEKMKAELGMKITLEDLDRIFFMKDFIIDQGFVSDNLSRQMSSRIVNTYMGWNNYLHSIVMPNPQNLLNINESKIFSQEEKKEMGKIMPKLMEISSRSTLLGLTKDKKEEGKFFNHAVEFWDGEFKGQMIDIMNKVNAGWSKAD